MGRIGRWRQARRARTVVVGLGMVVLGCGPGACREPRADAQTFAQNAGAKGVHATLRLTVTQTNPTKHDNWSPETFEGTLTLLPGGTGVITIGEHPGAAPWRTSAGRIVVGPVTVRRGGTELFWQRMALDIRDSDGDGWLDSGTGIARNVTWESGGGDYFPSVGARAEATFEGHRDPPSATLEGGGSWPDRPWLRRWPALPLMATDEVAVRFSEPVLSSAVVKQLQVRAGGRDISGAVKPAGNEAFATSFTFTPHEALPHAAELSLDLGTIADVIGARFVTAGPTVRVVADPGSLTTNPGFERDLTGWSVRGDGRVGSAHQDVPPASGSRQAIVEPEGQLVGYLDVAEAMSRLEFSIATLMEGNGDVVAAVWLRSGPEHVDLVPFEGEGGDGGKRRTVSVDLTPFRGKRVYLDMQTLGGGMWQKRTTLLIDDIRIR